MKTIDFEIRTSDLSASNKKLVGYAVRWNSLSEIIWDEFREQFAPGAFKDSLAYRIRRVCVCGYCGISAGGNERRISYQ